MKYRYILNSFCKKPSKQLILVYTFGIDERKLLVKLSKKYLNDVI